MNDRSQRSQGLVWGLGAYLFWGLIVFYFKAVAHVPALEVLAHRVVWSVVLLGIVLGFRGEWKQNLATAYKPKALGVLLITTALIAVNWYTFIWAIANERILQASLGYFINPLVNILLGFVVLRERLRPRQWVAVALATLGVVFMTVLVGEVPVVALILAFTFGLYGLLRKVMPVDALVGLLVETKLLLPIAIGYLLWLRADDALVFLANGLGTDLLLIAGGVVTAVPLLWFANAARRLDLATVGILQFLAPSMQFLIAVFVYDEPLRDVQLLSFGFIWSALALYSVDGWLNKRRVRGDLAAVKG